ncbi:FG-GAP-like repeat-containing protein [Caballeronia sp. LZ065]|uniref:FG-GAP-like repeat-containing protein n=1 Tax=Caballeronia sp. LZ065 TaxID=3038571 RepID=UPI00285DEA1A|nr:FG-GAP-like repeat-containing protein [Caballeronia sp. LZ065]MDR5780066.1 FG-GAP-like repeat-containing protein [Caballeronia sp. LZ065]
MGKGISVSRSVTAWLSLARAALLAILALSPLTASAAAPSADCSAGTLVTVVAHLDDDLLFVNPGISDKLKAGWCVTVVHLIGGSNDAKFDYVVLRETGTQLAYARMAGVADEWDESTVMFAGKPVHQIVLKPQPKVKLLELRLPGGHVRGGKVPLGLLWDRGETLTTHPMNADGSGATRYDRASLSATLREILSPATDIYTLNPDTVAFMEHPDHIYAARITRAVAQSLKRSVPISYHITYPTGGLPKNLSADEIQTKRDVVGSYFAIDGNEAGHVFGEYMWDGNWVARRYRTTARSNDPGPDFQLRPFQLVNEYSSRCIDSSGTGRAPRLAACSGAPSQNWFWQQLPVMPGDKNDALLVNAATRGCIAERDAGFVEQACSPSSPAQRWTPWDFGFVYTPLDHCLGEKDGLLDAGRCSMSTAQYRWSPSPQTVWTDARQEGALYGDVKGAGRDSVVYVQRRKDGPGFNVWVAEMSRMDQASPWYLNAVPFDPHATLTPTCTGDVLCFDSARFLLADVDGDGRADLMVITPRNGGTAFWLLKSTGAHFAAPRLWYQTSADWTPADAQQYVAGDFNGDGRADVLIARKRHDAGLDLDVLTAGPAGGNAPVRWLTAPELDAGARFMPARVAGAADARRAGLVALEDVNGALTLSQFTSSGSGFTPAYRTNVWPQFRAPFVKVVAGDIDGDGIDDLVVLEPRGDATGTRVFTMKGGKVFGAARESATLADTSYADSMPALIRRDEHDNHATLVFFRRANARLGEFYYTGGPPSVAGRDFDTGFNLGPVQLWGDLPGLFSESLWLKTLGYWGR